MESGKLSSPERTQRKSHFLYPAVLLVLGAVSYWYAHYGEYALLFHQLALIFLYPAAVLIFAALFSQIRALACFDGKKKRKKTNKKPADLFARYKLWRMHTGKNGKKHINETAGEQAAEHAPETEPPVEGLHVIKQREEGVETRVKRDKKLILAEALYVVLQITAAATFLWLMFKITLPMTPGYFKFSFLHSAIFVIIAGAALSAGKVISLKNPEGFEKTACGFLRILGVLLIVFALAVALRLLFSLDSTAFLFWTCRILSVALVLLTGIAIIYAGVRRALLDDFGYTLLPRKVKGSGFLDALEENTGLSLKSLWSIKFLGSILPGAVLCIAALLFLASSVYVVSPQQQAAVYRLGSLDENSVSVPGIHLKLPWPLDKVEYYETERIRTLQIGYQSTGSKDFLWGQSHDGGEHTLLLGNGTELVAANIKITYRIDDLYRYLTTTADPESMLSSMAYEFLMAQTASSTLDEFLSVDRSGLSEKMTAELDRLCLESGLGLTVHGAVIESIHPPIEIADVYQNVINAALEKSTMIISADTQAEKILLDASSQSERLLIDAMTSRTSRVAAAQYEMAVYYAAFEAYTSSPESFMLNKYLTTFEKIVSGNKVYVFGPGTDEDMSKYVFGANRGQVVLEPAAGGDE